jgi:hypothetical protein
VKKVYGCMEGNGKKLKSLMKLTVFANDLAVLKMKVLGFQKKKTDE